MKKLSYLAQACSAAAALLVAIPSAFAGGAFSTTPAGQPVLWDGPVIWRAETGPIKGATGDADGGGGGGGGGSSGGGCQLTKSLDINNAQAIDIVRNAFNAWDNVPNASIDIQEGPSLGVDVNFDNVENFWVGSFFGGTQSSTVTADGCYDGDPATECLNSVIFDSTSVAERSITDAIQGQCARFSILAFAAILPQTANDAQGTITNPALKSSQMVISGACVQPVIAPDSACDFPDTADNEGSCPAGGISLEELQGTVTHEVGHYLGLDHTLTNKRNYIACQTGNGECDLENIPTMIGLFTPGANLGTLHYDDQTTFARYYPAGGGAGTCTIKGVVNHAQQFGGRCMEVVARLNNSEATAASFVAGSEVPRPTQGIPGSSGTSGKNQSNCTAGDQSCGTYEIRGLQPGSYSIGVQNFSDSGAGSGLPSFILEPCTPALTSAAFRFGDFGTIAGTPQFTVNCVAGSPVTQNLNAN